MQSFIDFLTGRRKFSREPQISGHPDYDPKTMRVLASPARLRHLPVRQITPEQDYQLRMGWYWNGIEFYPSSVPPLDGEVGYDQTARYVVVRD